MTMGIGEIATGVKLTKDLATLGKELGWWDRLKSMLKEKHEILVLGCSGVGKTQFLDSLVQLLPQTISSSDRSQNNHERVYQVENTLFRITDTPGESLHEAKRKKAILDAFRRNISGVINVVSYGYHEYSTGQTAAITQAGHANKHFLNEHRKLEIEQLNEWTEVLGEQGKDRWLMSVVTKADLWWDDHERVAEWYQKGDYAQSLGRAAGLNCMVCLHSSVRHKFFESSPMSGHFDDKTREQLRAQLVKCLLQVANPSE